MDIVEALDRAIAAHAKWKYRLMEAIDSGHSPWHVGDVRGDCGCEFGKWLVALPLSQRLARHCREVKTLHAEFHELAAGVLQLAISGRKDEAAKAIALGSRFAAVSSSLTLAVLAWQQDRTD